MISADAPFPSGASETDWRHTNDREASDVNAQVREAVDRDGYSLFEIGLSLFRNSEARLRRVAFRMAAGKQHPKVPFTIGEPFAVRFDLHLRYRMTQAQHYKFQADQAKRLARQVTDSEVRERLLEMAGEYSRYAELMEARERPREQALG